MHYSEATKTREGWARDLLEEFKSNVNMLKCAVGDQQGSAPAHGSPQHGKQTHSDIQYTACVCMCVCACVFVASPDANAALHQHLRHPCGFSVLQCPLGTKCMGL